MQNFNDLREKYKEFIYKDFKIYEENNNIILKLQDLLNSNLQ